MGVLSTKFHCDWECIGDTLHKFDKLSLPVFVAASVNVGLDFVEYDDLFIFIASQANAVIPTVGADSWDET